VISVPFLFFTDPLFMLNTYNITYIFTIPVSYFGLPRLCVYHNSSVCSLHTEVRYLYKTHSLEEIFPPKYLCRILRTATVLGEGCASAEICNQVYDTFPLPILGAVFRPNLCYRNEMNLRAPRPVGIRFQQILNLLANLLRVLPHKHISLPPAYLWSELR
jgi:hypothetical protein